MTVTEEAVISMLAIFPGDFRNILIGKARKGKPKPTFYDLSVENPKSNAENLYEALKAAGYEVSDLKDVGSLCFKLLKTIQKNRETTQALAKVLGDYDPAYGDEGDHPPEEEGEELLRLVQSLPLAKQRLRK